MAGITAQLVKDLREKTGAGMMDCKAALTATGGDMNAAVDWLRAKGLAKAAKKSTRVAAEGLVGLAGGGTAAALVEVNSETDFVARNDKFQAMVGEIAGLALAVKGDLEALKVAHYPGSPHAVAAYVAEMVASIGENMTVRRAACLSVAEGLVASYVHGQIAPGLGKIGVIAALESKGKADELGSFGRQLAMQIAAANPVALDLAGVPPETIAREKAILAEKNAGKPEKVLEKIMEQGLKSYAKENCLLDQAWVHDSSKTVTQALAEAGSRAGAPVRIAGFARMQLGEGIEKGPDDFAGEVAKAAKGE